MTTADKIRELIEEKGLTQRQFAELVGIHYITLCNNLKNDILVIRALKRLLKPLGCLYMIYLPMRPKIGTLPADAVIIVYMRIPMFFGVA